MPNAYWVTCYREVKDPSKLAAYAQLAGPAIAAAGGRFLARGLPAAVHESGQFERTVLIEFDSMAQVVAAYESAAYRVALKALGDGAVRDIRFIAGA